MKSGKKGRGLDVLTGKDKQTNNIFDKKESDSDVEDYLGGLEEDEMDKHGLNLPSDLEGENEEEDNILDYEAEEGEDEEDEGLFGLDNGSDAAFNDIRDDFDGTQFGIGSDKK